MMGRASLPGLLIVVAACADAGEVTRPRDVTAEISDSIRTVVHVNWTTDEPTVGYVEYGPTEDMEFTTPIEEEQAEEHELSLLGLTADTEYFYRVVTWDGGNGAASDIATIQTGNLPPGMPPLDVEGDGHDMFTIVPILGQTTAVTIINPQGEIVWYHQDDRDLDFYRARLSVDGQSLIYNAGSVSGDPADDSQLVRVALDGTGSEAIAVPLLAHDFVEHPDGTLAAIVVEYREVDGEEVKGDKIVEVSPEGEQTTVWSAWDCFDPAVHQGDDDELGWTFANSLDYDPFEDVYYLGMRNFSSITRIDRSTGECEWVLGLTARTIDFADGSARFLHQHQFDVRGDHILVFDNEGSSNQDESRVLEYELDLEANRATQVWSYVSDPVVDTFVLGEPIRLDDGDTFVDWSASGLMERVDETGNSDWRISTTAGFVFGFVTLSDSLYPPDAQTP